MGKEQIYFIGGWFGCTFGWLLSELFNSNVFLAFVFFLASFFVGQHICSKICGDEDDSGQKTESDQG